MGVTWLPAGSGGGAGRGAVPELEVISCLMHRSQISQNVRILGWLVKMLIAGSHTTVSDAVGLGCSLRICISN